MRTFKFLTTKVHRSNFRFKLINIVGLTLGLTCGIILFLIVRYEKSYDTYHQNYERIYRVVQTIQSEGRTNHQVGVPKPLPYTLRDKISGIDNLTHFFHSRYGEFNVTNADGTINTFHENPGLVYAEPELFEIFDWNWLAGDEQTALIEPNTIVLDHEKAEKYFGDAEAIGQTVNLRGLGDLKVTGVVERRPNNSDFPFQLFVSMKSISEGEDFTRWTSVRSDDRVYVLLSEGTSVENVEQQINDVLDEQFGAERSLEGKLQPLSDIHFDEQWGNLNYRVASESYITTLSLVSVFIVLIACFNFINMSTAVALNKAKEVGIRKVLGSTRSELIKRHMLNTFFVVLASMLVSLGLVELLMPTIVEDFAGTVIDYNFLYDLEIPATLFLLIITVTLIAGYYPARVISQFKPTDALRNSYSSGKKGMILRRSLVIVQFAFAIIFLFGTAVVYQQSKYARDVSLGGLDDWIVFLNLQTVDENTTNKWMGELERIPGVNDYSFSSYTPFSGSSSSTDARFTQNEEVISFTAFMKPADNAYIDTYDLELITGESYVEMETVSGFVVNEAFVKKMNLQTPEEAIGQSIEYSGMKADIKGVVKDFHTYTTKREILPVILFDDNRPYRTLGVKVNPTNADNVLANLERAWESIYPEEAFGYRFYDDYIAQYYYQEKKTSQMLLIFACIAVAITCLGLYGIVSFMANMRTKEIGVRKVMGASVAHLMQLFSWEFVRLVFIAFILGSPIAYWLMNQWLDGYIYRIEIGPFIFVSCLIATLIIALATTGLRSFKAASANPVYSLRDE